MEALTAEHGRSGFSCGQQPLDLYFQTQVTQDARRRVASCFVAVEVASGLIAGYYTLASAGIPFLDLPPDISKRLPRYPSIPAVRVGRLAVDSRFQGQGIGSALLADALARVLAAAPAAYAILVDAKDERAEAFYLHLGFMPLASSRSRTLFLPVATAAKALGLPPSR